MIRVFKGWGHEKNRREVSHDWVIYRNPRNGRVQITACKACGSMLSEKVGSEFCNGQRKNVAEHPILSKGWLTDGKPAYGPEPTNPLKQAS